jgi:periplasmic divalent cation tolerance protein
VSETGALVVLCTCPDTGTAESLANGLITNRLAACVNILPEIRSIYRWQNEIQKDAEVLMLVKSSRRVYARLERWLLEHHPYDVPEVLALPVDAGADEYLGWIDQETRETGKSQ